MSFTASPQVVSETLQHCIVGLRGYFISFFCSHTVEIQADSEIIWNRKRPRAPVTASTDKEVNQHSKDVTQTQQQRLESPTLTLTWHASKRFKTPPEIHSPHHLILENAHLVDLLHRVFTRMQSESYRWAFTSLLCFCYVFRALINSLVCWFC